MATIKTTKSDGSAWELTCTENQIRGWIEILKQRFRLAHRKSATIKVIHDSGDIQTIRWEKLDFNN